MKACPFCAEEVQDAAIVCRHCQRDITAPPDLSRTAAAKRGRRPMWWALAGFLLLAFVGWLYAFAVAREAHQVDVDRWHADCDRVMNQRGPGTAEDQQTRQACMSRRDALRVEAAEQGF